MSVRRHIKVHYKQKYIKFFIYSSIVYIKKLERNINEIKKENNIVI